MIATLKNIFVFALLLIISPCGFSQTTLSAGAIAFTGINCTDNTINGSTSNDDICFVLLKNITTGTTIYFTDFGWCSVTPAFQSANPCGGNTGALTDGAVKWVATTDMTYGTQVVIRCKVTPSANLGTASAEQATFNSSTTFVSISVSGESIFAYTGSLASPTLIAGINTNNNGWAATLDNCALQPTISVLPAALATNDYAFTLNFTGNARLKAGLVLSADPVTARAQIANVANWEKDANNAYLLPAAITTLPVKFISFTAVKSTGGNTLKWAVAEESAGTRYEIQRSNDGIRFTPVTTVNGKNQPANHYEYNDASATGNVYYRIKSTSTDAEVIYSNTVPVKNNGTRLQLSVFPNPAVEKLTVDNVPAGATLELFDNNGKLLYTKKADARNDIDISRYPAGVYIVKLKGSMEAVRFVKQ